MGETRSSRGRESARRIWITLSNLSHLVFVPGVVVHEAGHALACRLLGVQVTKVVLYQWPADVTRDIAGHGYVSHAEPDSTWKTVLISTAPLVTNTAGALVLFWLARWVVAGAVTSGSATTGVPLDGQSVAAFMSLDTGSRLLVLLGVWLGGSMAFTGFPSEQDLRIVGRCFESFRSTFERPTRLRYVFHHVRGEAATLYTLLVAGIGLFGLDVVFSITPGRVAYLLALGVPVLIVDVARGESDRLPNRRVADLNRVRRSARRAADGAELDRDDVRFLIDTLSDSNQRLRETAAGAVRDVANHHPESLSEASSEILRRAEAERAPDVRRRVLAAAYLAYDQIDDVRRLVSIALAALEAETLGVRHKAPQVLAKVAYDEPALLSDHVEAMFDALGDVSDIQRGNLLLAFALVAASDPSRPTLSADASPPPPEPRADSAPSVAADARSEVLRAVPDGVRVLVETVLTHLDDSAPVVRSKAVVGLGYVGREYPAAVAPLVDPLASLFDDESDVVRSEVASALSRVAKADPDAVADASSVLLAHLDDEEEEVRRDSARAVRTIAEADPDSVSDGVEPLLALLDEEDAATRSAAVLALWRIASTSPEKVTPEIDRIVDRIDDSDDTVRSNALGALSELAGSDPEVVAEFTDVVGPFLDDADLAARVNAGAMFSRLAETHRERVQPWTDAFRTSIDADDYRERENAAGVLSGIAETDPERVVSVRASLIDRLDDEQDDIRAAAASAIDDLAAAYPLLVEQYLDGLVDALGDDDRRVREHALAAVASVSLARYGTEQS